MEINRAAVIERIENLISGKELREDIGWWAYDLLLEEGLKFEPGYERLLEDCLRSLHYFHDTEPFMREFYPDATELQYYLSCLKGNEIYQRSRVIHWRV